MINSIVNCFNIISFSEAPFAHIIVYDDDGWGNVAYEESVPRYINGKYPTQL